MFARALRVWVAFFVTCVAASTAIADEPTNSADSFFYYSHRPDPKGDVSGSLAQTSLFTGASSTSVPIIVPRGTGGVQPDLALSYSSSRPHGDAGAGWSLDIPSIARSTKYAGQEVFVLDGEELIAGGSDTDPFGCPSTRYYSRVEHFQKILRCQRGANDYWVLLERDGTAKTFGKSQQARLGKSTGAMAPSLSIGLGVGIGKGKGKGNRPPPQSSVGEIGEWYLDSVTDTHGLSWTAQFDGYGTGGTGEAPRLKRIEYTFLNGVPVGDVREVDFQWEPVPSTGALGNAETVDWHYGFPVVYDQRLASIEVQLGGQRVRRYALSYDADGNAANGEQLSPSTRESILHSVQMFGLTDAAQDSLPAMTFEYQYGDASFATQPRVHFTGPQVPSLQDGKGTLAVDLVDINGDGYPDVVDASNPTNWQVRFGRGAGGFDASPMSFPGANSNIREIAQLPDPEPPFLAPPNVVKELIDMNGDGLPDMFTGGTVALNNGASFGQKVGWSTPSGSPTDVTEFVRTKDASISGAPEITDTISTVIDLDGDGCPDRLQVRNVVASNGGHPYSVWFFYRNRACEETPVLGFAAPVIWTFPVLDAVPAYLQRDYTLSANPGPSYTLAGLVDLNGDGLPDWFNHGQVLMNNGHGFEPEVGTGYSGSIAAVESGRSPDGSRFLSVSQPFGLEQGLIDINGDGRPDWVISNGDTFFFDESSHSHPGEDCSGGEPGPKPPSYWTVHLNNGNSFGPAIQWSASDTYGQELGYLQTDRTSGCLDVTNGQGGVPPQLVVKNYGLTRVIDLTGVGVSQFVRILDDANWQIFDGAGRKSDLLVAINNGVGGRTEITYGSAVGGSTGRLHFPVAVVTETRTFEGLVTQEYGRGGPPVGAESVYHAVFSYSAGYFDADHRAFRGFGQVNVEHFEDATAPPPPILNQPYELEGPLTPPRFEQHFFATGSSGRPILFITFPIQCPQQIVDAAGLEGYEIASFSGPDPSTFLHAEFSGWSAVAPPNSPAGVIAPELVISRSGDFDPAGGASRVREMVSTYGDAFGNVTATSDLGEIGCATDPGNDDVYSKTQYAVNTQKWIVSLPSLTQTCSDANCSAVLREQHFLYDGLAEGSVGIGDITDSETLVRYPGESDLFAVNHSDHDVYGNVIRSVDPQGGITLLSYADSSILTPDSFAYLHQKQSIVSKGKTTPVTLTESFGWDERFGVATSEIGPNGRQTLTSLDGLGRTTQIRSTPPNDPSGTPVVLTDLSYSLGGLSSSFFPFSTSNSTSNFIRRVDYFGTGSGQGVESRIYFDGLLRPVQEKHQADNGQWTATNRRYTWQGSTDVEVLAYFTSSPEFSFFPFWDSSEPARRMAHDWDGREIDRRLVDVSGGSHFETQTSYSVWDDTVTNPRGNQTVHRRDAHGRIILVQERSGAAPQANTIYSYDPVGDLTDVEDNQHNHFSMQYDTRGLKRAMIDPDMSTCPSTAKCPWLYSYDLAGRLVKQVDAKGQEIDFSVDELGRVYAKHYADPAAVEVDVAFDYDDATNALGRLVSTNKGSQSQAFYSYDNWGRATAIERDVLSSRAVTSTTYDLLGRPTDVNYPTGEDAVYAYQPAGIHQVTFAGISIIADATYDSLGRATQLVWGNGLQTNTLIGSNEKVESLIVASPGSTLDALSYLYDEDGNTTKIFQDANQGWTRSFGYDWADRLISAEHDAPGATPVTWAWTYDEIGNMTSNSDWGSASKPGLDGTYQYGTSGAGPHAVSRIGGNVNGAHKFDYDADGSMVAESIQGSAGSLRAFSYNFDGRIATADAPSQPVDPAASFSYDGAGDRSRKSWTGGGSVANDLRYFGLDYEELRTGTGPVERDRYVLLGSARLALVTGPTGNPTVSFLHPDVQGTIGLTSDATGLSVDRRVYAPYGELFEEDGSLGSLRYGYTGQEHDPESDQIHLGVREFEPSIARMSAADALVPDPGSPQTLNRYSYALNNPLRYTDPSGYDPLTKPAQNANPCDKGGSANACLKWLQSRTGISNAADLKKAFDYYYLHGNYVAEQTEKAHDAAVNQGLPPEQVNAATIKAGISATAKVYIQTAVPMAIGGVADAAVGAVGSAADPTMGLAGSSGSGTAGATVGSGSSEMTIAANEAFRAAQLQEATGTVENIAGFRVYGSKALVGPTFERNIFLIEREPSTDISGIRTLFDTMRAEAASEGASQLNIVGYHVINQNIFSEQVAARYGFALRQINADTVLLTAPIQAAP